MLQHERTHGTAPYYFRACHIPFCIPLRISSVSRLIRQAKKTPKLALCACACPIAFYTTHQPQPLRWTGFAPCFFSDYACAFPGPPFCLGPVVGARATRPSRRPLPRILHSSSRVLTHPLLRRVPRTSALPPLLLCISCGPVGGSPACIFSFAPRPARGGRRGAASASRITHRASGGIFRR